MKNQLFHYCTLNVTIPSALKEEEDRDLTKGCKINLNMAADAILKKVFQAYSDNRNFVNISQAAFEFLKGRLGLGTIEGERYDFKAFSYALVLTELSCDDPHGMYSHIKYGGQVNLHFASIEVLELLKVTHQNYPGLIWFQPGGLKTLKTRLRLAKRQRAAQKKSKK